MAEDFIEEIYKKANITVALKQMACNCRSNKLETVNNQWRSMLDNMVELCQDIAMYDTNLSADIWDKLVHIRDNMEILYFRDVADQLDALVVDLYKVIKNDGIIDVVDGNYRLYSTESGFLSIENINNGVNYYSRVNPVWEKYELSKSLYIPTMKHFVVMGCGMAYLPWEMYNVADEGIDVYIFDTNQTMVQYAKNYGVLDKIPDEHLHVYVEENNNDLLSKLYDVIKDFREHETVLHIEQFYYEQMTETEKEVVYSIMVNSQTQLSYREMLEQNYYLNHDRVKSLVSDVDWSEYSKEWIVVGGGSSVTDNIDYLKQQKGKKTIVAASTIFRVLLSNNIEPDIVVAIDPQKRTYGHMDGIKCSSPILIIDDTANWRFGEFYVGKKYLVDTNYMYYSSHPGNPGKWGSQRTVTGFAIELAVYAGAKVVELVGADLSYPDGFSHAKGTMDYASVDSNDLISVKSVDGGCVLTDETLRLYLQDIEEQIEKHKSVCFRNLSKHGALIKGCK